MSRVWRALAALFLLGAAGRRRRREERRRRIVPEAAGHPGAEIAVAVLLVLTAACSAAFVVFFATDSLEGQTQLMGAALGAAFIFLAAALILASKRLIVSEELEEAYPKAAHPEEQEEVAQIVAESGDRITRKGLIRTYRRRGDGHTRRGTRHAVALVRPVAEDP